MTSSKIRDAWAQRRRAERRERRRREYQSGLRPMAVAAWNISKEYNVGSLIRTAHAAAVEEVILVGEREWNVEAARTAELYTKIIYLPGKDEFLEHLEERGWDLVAIELDARSVSLFDAVYPPRPCFLLGAELGGIPNELLEASRLIVEIPQWGLVPCLNVAVAGSIVLYDHLSKLHRRGSLDRPSLPGRPA